MYTFVYCFLFFLQNSIADNSEKSKSNVSSSHTATETVVMPTKQNHLTPSGRSLNSYCFSYRSLHWIYFIWYLSVYYLSSWILFNLTLFNLLPFNIYKQLVCLAISHFHFMMTDAATGWWCLILDTSLHQKHSSSSHHRRREREKSDSKENPDVIQQQPRVQPTAGRLCRLAMFLA